MNKSIIRSANLKGIRGTEVKLPSLLDNPAHADEWKQRVHSNEELIALDLFCGAGGMSLGFEQAGFLVAAGIDFDRSACNTHAANLLSKTICGNLTEITDPARLIEEIGIPRVDVIVGGPPCQGFSLAGVSKLRSLAEHDPEVQKEVDAKNRLYKEFVNFVAAIHPPMFVMENVPHLSSFGQGVVAQQIHDDFAAVGYEVVSFLLDAAKYGVPQHRRRLFYVGRRKGIPWRKPEPLAAQPVSLWDAISDLPPVEAPSLIEELPYPGPPESPYQQIMRREMTGRLVDLVFDHIVRPVREDDRHIFSLMTEGNHYLDVPVEYRRYKSESFQDKYYKLPKGRPANTITAHLSRDGYRYIHPVQLRTISVREAARIQSFPDHFRFTGFRSSRFRQIGNAVPPLLAQAIAVEIKRSLQAFRRGETEELISDSNLERHRQLRLP